MTRRILGIDPGTGILGFGVIDAEIGKSPKMITGGVISTPAHTPIEIRLEEIYNGLTEIIAETKPTEVSIEKLFFSKNVTTAISVAQARGVAILAAQQHRPVGMPRPHVPHIAPHRVLKGQRLRARLLTAALVIGEELHRDVEEQRAADELEVGRGEQSRREERAADADEDGAHAADEDGAPPVMRRQVLAGERDEDGVVAGEDEV